MRMRKEVFILSIDDILPNRFQPRIKFDEKAILELAESIKKHGVIQPIIVRKIADKYEIIAGERRYKASVIAGRKTIPAIITDVNDKESAEIALIENVQRQDMTPIEEAISYKKILDMGYLNQSELAIKLGKTQSTIANKLRLLNLSDEVQEALLDEKISERHARSLLRLDKSKQKEVLDKIIKERLTVRKTDQLINSILNVKEAKKEEKGEKMNNENNNINNNFNIPTNPIIEDQSNPGFMNISNIENNAQDINNNYQQPQNTQFNPFGNPFTSQQPQESVQPSESVNEIPQFNSFVAQQPQENVQPSEPVNEVPQFNPFITQQPQENVQPSEPVNEVPQFNPFTSQQPQENIKPSEPVNEVPQFNPFTSQQPQENIKPSEPVNEVPQFNPFTSQQPQESVQPSEPVNEVPQFNPFITQQPQESVQPNESVNEVPQFNPYTQPTMKSSINNDNQSYNYTLPEDKELTPLMPSMENDQTARVDFKTIINMIRNCTDEIEKMGYKIDVDELDSENSYEFSIKIDKE